MLKQEYNRMNEKIQPDPGLKEAVLDRAVPKQAPRPRPVIAVALALVVMLSVPVMAAYGSDILYWIRNTPLVNVQEDCVANGIRMEVVGVTAEENRAYVLLRFEYADGTPVGGELLPQQVYFDAYHTWYLTGCRSYFTETEELVMLELTCRGGNLEEFYGNQINVIVDSVRLTEPDPYVVPLALTDSETVTVPGDFLENEAVHDTFRTFGVGASDGNEEFLSREAYTLIAPGEAVYDVTERVGITGMRFIDDQLHIQICQTVPYDAGSFIVWLEDGEGNRVYDYAWHNFQLGEDGCIVGREHYFDISAEELDEYRLMVEVENTIEGPWKVSFELNEGGESETAE